jgi:hypothetical protein
LQFSEKSSNFAVEFETARYEKVLGFGSAFDGLGRMYGARERGAKRLAQGGCGQFVE